MSAPDPMLFAQFPADRSPKLYRPSNGTEGDCFHAKWCAHCEKERMYRQDRDNDGCQILIWTMAVGIDDDDYPAEWIEDERGPRCTAFEEEVRS
jgi:hypothetical protein